MINGGRGSLLHEDGKKMGEGVWLWAGNEKKINVGFCYFGKVAHNCFESINVSIYETESNGKSMELGCV